MVSISPEQAAFLVEYRLPSVKNEYRATSAVIAAIPASNGDYRPDPQARSAAEIAWHIAASEHRFWRGIISGTFDFNAIPRPEGGLTPASVLTWYEQSFASSFEKLTRLTGEQAARILEFRGGLRLPAAAFFDVCVHHSIHHRGQLSTYLRAMGGRVPAIYGESYDSAEAKKSAS